MRSSRELASNPRHYAHRMPHPSENPGIAFFEDQNPLSTGAMVGIGLGVAAAIGLGYYFYTKQAAAAPPPAPANPLTQPVTDPTAIQTAQQQLALIATNGLATGLTSANYSSSMVNGNATDPQFVAALAVFQKAVNAHGGYTPPGGKGMTLNTSGTLDQATAAALAVIASSPVSKVGGAAPVSDITTVFGPYTNISGSSMQPGEVYLYSSPAQSGQTVDSAANHLSNSGFLVYQYWDQSVIPPSWPIDDASPYEWRFVIQNAGSSPVNPGAGNLYATGGAVSGLPAGVGQMPDSSGMAVSLSSTVNPNGIVPVPSGLHWKLSNRAWPGTSSSQPVLVNMPPNMQGFYQLEGNMMRFAATLAPAVSAPSVTSPGTGISQVPMMPALVWIVYEWAPGAYRALSPQALATLAAATIQAPGVVRWAGIPQATPASQMQQTTWSPNRTASVADPGSGVPLYVTYSIGQKGPLAGRLRVVVVQRYAFLFNRVVLMPIGPCPPGQAMINGKCQMTFGARGIVHHA